MEFERIREIISSQLGVHADNITMETSFADDLGADSLDLVELVMALEEEFDVEMPDEEIENIINSLEVKEADLELENDNNNPKITTGTKIRSKTNPDVILSIISNDCHEDEYECSNGSVLSLKQIEKYYDLII